MPQPDRPLPTSLHIAPVGRAPSISALCSCCSLITAGFSQGSRSFLQGLISTPSRCLWVVQLAQAVPTLMGRQLLDESQWATSLPPSLKPRLIVVVDITRLMVTSPH